MDPVLSQILTAGLGTGGIGAVLIQLIAMRRERSRNTAPLSEAAARLDIVKQLELERVARATAERQRDDAIDRAATAGRERDAADRRAEAADRRANTERRSAEAWEAHAVEVRELCLAHGTPRDLLPDRPAVHH